MMKSEVAKTIDEYLAGVPQEYRIALVKLMHQIKSTAPKAEETIWYQMPTLTLGKPLVGFAAFKNHCSFFPMSSKTTKLFANELKDFKTSAGTIQFTPEKPLPAILVKKIVKARIKENAEILKQKELKAKTKTKRK